MVHIQSNGTYKAWESNTDTEVSDPIPHTDSGHDTAYLIIEYDRSKPLLPALDAVIAEYIHDLAIKKGEEEMIKNNEHVKNGEKYVQESVEHQFANYLYEFPNDTKVTESKVTAKPLDFAQIDQEYYSQEEAFYYFKIDGEEHVQDVMDDFSDEIMNCAQTIMANDDGFKNAVKDKINDVGTPDPMPIFSSPDTKYEGNFDGGDGSKHEFTEATFDGITAITSITVEDEYVKTPDFRQVSSYTGEITLANGETRKLNAVYTIKEETIALTMDVPQKRCSAMLVTGAETWAKSIKYNNKIVQNQFEPDNYRFVIPHSWYGFGLRVFNVNEDATYRTEYYKDYFSNPDGESESPSAIKEADVMSMFLKWEEYGENGVDTAYVFIRDLYKMAMYLREEGKIHDNAYSFMYVPEDIWDFREGITQEAYWTQLLAADMYGADAMKQDELNWMRVKKNVIKWQQLDYSDYEECVNDDGSAKVYALFPHGNEYTRAWFMEYAVANHKFYDGGYKNGHGGADWTSRARSAQMLSLGQGADPSTVDIDEEEGIEKSNADIYLSIYESELRRKTIRNIWEGSDSSTNKISSITNFWNQFGSAGGAYTQTTAYANAKTELDKQLKDYSTKSPIVSVATGVVTKSYYNCYGGFAVHVAHILDEGDNIKMKTTYAHMRRWPEVQQGDIVGPGTIVGYEGTTGNSGGFHLHMGMDIGGNKQSPSRYMGPIFSPFYNKEKIKELTNQAPYSTDNRLLLGTDYLSLIRTVLLPRFNGKKLSDVVVDNSNGIYLSSASFVNIDGVPSDNIAAGLYIQYDDSEDAVYYMTDSSHVIVKEGINDPVYWKCAVEKVEIDVGYIGQNVVDVDDDGNTISSTKRIKTMLKVNSKQQITLGDVVNLGQVSVNTSVTTQNIVWEPAEVVWGNNVPFLPLVNDSSEIYDIAALTVAKVFKRPENTDKLGGNFTKGKDLPDVRAMSECFDANSALVQNHMKIPASLLLAMSDAVNPYAVPFYDGPIAETGGQPGAYDYYSSNPSPTVNGGNYGYAGTVSGDLQKLQLALKAKGFAPDTMNTDGIFDADTQTAIQNATDAMSAAGFPYGIGWGRNGKLGYFASSYFDMGWVQSWNGYVTYGTYKNAVTAGKTAIGYASAITGLDYNFLLAVSRQEGGVFPTRESIEFVKGKGSISFATNESLAAVVPGDGNLVDLDTIIEYPDGQPRIVRRAQGMFQLTWSVGAGRLKAKGITGIEEIVSCIRSPITNAMLASEYLRDNQQQVLSNRASLSVSNPYTEIKNFMKSGSTGAKAWQAAANYANTSPETLFIYAMSAIMYNKGPGADSKYFEGLKNVTWNSSTHRLSSSGSTGYGLTVVNSMINN